MGNYPLIRDNRSIEKENRREEESFDLSPKEKDSSKSALKTDPDKSSSSPKPSLQPNYTDLLRAKREKNKRGKN